MRQKLYHTREVAKLKTNQQLVSELRDDYNSATSRIKKLRHEQRYYITNQNQDELKELEDFVAVVDGIVARLPREQQEITRRAILAYTPLDEVADEVGYTYNWVSVLKVEATKKIVAIVTGEDVISGTLGCILREVVK